jgi:hypothetical protein
VPLAIRTGWQALEHGRDHVHVRLSMAQERELTAQFVLSC